MYYPSSENNGADQLRGYREADLHLCFRICRLLVFPWGGSNVDLDVEIQCKQMTRFLICQKYGKKCLLMSFKVNTTICELPSEEKKFEREFGN